MSENVKTTVVISEHTSAKKLFDAIKAAEKPVLIKLADGKGERVFASDAEATASVLNNYSYRLNKLGGWVVSSEGTTSTTASTGESKPKASKVARRRNPQVTLDLEGGVVVFALENAIATYDCKTGNLSADLSAHKFHSFAMNAFASNPRDYILGATELDENGSPIAGGWMLDGYTSGKMVAAEAAADMLAQATSKTDIAWLKTHAVDILTGTAEVLPQKTGVKVEFADKWFPKPVETPAPAPAEDVPAPAPADIEVVGSLKAEPAPAPAKKNRKAAVVS